MHSFALMVSLCSYGNFANGELGWCNSAISQTSETVISPQIAAPCGSVFDNVLWENEKEYLDFVKWAQSRHLGQPEVCYHTKPLIS